MYEEVVNQITLDRAAPGVQMGRELKVQVSLQQLDAAEAGKHEGINAEGMPG